jgi:Carboxypeptidase regulatory-like domain/TonB-dependent Receptor Plug Domain
MSKRIGWRVSLPLVVFLALGGPAALHAQILVGRVVDAESGQRIAHADVELLNDRDQTITRVGVDSAGVFRIRSWHAGKYRLRANVLGYETVLSDLLELATGDVLEVTVRLAPNAVPLEPIVINARARATLAELALAGYYDRRDSGSRLGFGRFFDRGAIERRGRRLTEVLATVPGVRVLHVMNCPVPLVSMGGNSASRLQQRSESELRRLSESDACSPATVCRANVYVDGVQMHWNETISIDQVVPMQWIEAIEVYRRASEVPAEFLSRATCGVVAIWTRRG